MQSVRNILIAASVIVFSASAFATAKDVSHKMRAASTTGAYGEAGCGLGSIVFGNQPGYIQIVAATLNGTGGQTFAITTGTSNCAPAAQGLAAALFIKSNGETLRKDIARGQGETVDSLALILNCQDSQLLGQTLRANFSSVMNQNADADEKSKLIQETISATPRLKASCLAAS